ncbi:MAG: DNA (cytosine-5-)-methyltransferase, partial [Chloroflexi bacterium]|nr:DNA (cytosine-5-)-methyltransferase [Chloroflexota bacterium]
MGLDQFKFIDLFAGIGGFRLGLEAIGGVCIASSEIEKNAISVYQQNWNDPENHNLGDISQ